MRMRRLNVALSHLEICVRESIFGLEFGHGKEPKFKPGDWLLLQLNQGDAEKWGKLDQRIEYAIIFDYQRRDADGQISQTYWDRPWEWIIYGSRTLRARPFSFRLLNFQSPILHKILPHILKSKM